jgi:hypothetical protein
VAKGSAPDTISPLFCVECDANTWYRWSGRSYEAELHAVGEELLSADDTTNRKGRELRVFAKPSRGSRVLFRIEHCTEALVRQVAGSENDRWYRVEMKGRPQIQGWMPGSSVAGRGECIG